MATITKVPVRFIPPSSKGHHELSQLTKDRIWGGLTILFVVALIALVVWLAGETPSTPASDMYYWMP